MREIKFRAWAPAIKQMVYMDGPKCVLYGYDEGEQWGMFLPFKSKEVCLSGYTAVMQHTGLKDKNGRDVYEGDIVNRLDSSGTDHFKGNFVVEFDEMWCCFSVRNNQGVFMTEDGYFCLFRDRPDFWEVIGNIYENPELLDGKEEKD